MKLFGVKKSYLRHLYTDVFNKHQEIKDISRRRAISRIHFTHKYSSKNSIQLNFIVTWIILLRVLGEADKIQYFNKQLLNYHHVL